MKIVKAIGTCFGIAGSIFLSFFSATTAVAQVSITANAPTYNFQVLPGSIRQINVNITGGTKNRVNWSVLSTTGGAFATLTTPNSTQVASIAAELPTVQVNIGSAAGNCAIAGAMGSYSVTSTATVTVQAQSVDDTSKTAKFLFNVCARTTNVVVAPAYQQAFKSQHRTLQSWVSGDTDETGTWSIVSQPSGGDGKLADTTNRDADFVATVTGRYTLKYISNSNSSQSATAIVYVSPNSMPKYTATPNGTEPRECYVDPQLTGGDYEVGAGKAYPSLQSTPAGNLIAPGSIIRVWNTDTTGSKPSTFNEYYQLHNSGTPAQPILLCGVPDGSGNLPIIDGSNATTQAGTSTGAAAAYGVITTWAGGFGNGTPYSYWQGGSAGPSYVSITGLHVRNATPSFTYTPPGGGSPTPYIDGASCLNIRSGSYIDLSGNDLDTCTNGIFTAENTNSAWAPVTQDVTVMGNHIHGSGYQTGYGDHQMYFQSFYGLAQGNRIDNYTSTAQGSNIKWRGVEGIFRYNYMGVDSTGKNGPTREFDAVENQDAAPYVSFEAYLSNPGQTNCYTSLYCAGDSAGANVIAAYQESAQKDFVYGNLMFNAGAAEQQVHYAEDHDGGMSSKNGSLYFFNNTMDNAEVIFDTGSGNGYNMYLQQRIFAANNIFWNPSEIAYNRLESIILTATTNLAKTGTFSIATPITGGGYSAFTAMGWQNGCDYTCFWPLSNPIDAHLYGLTSANYLATSTQPYDPTTMVPPNGSAAIGAGTATSGILAQMPVRWQYSVASNSLSPRLYPLTIGAVDQSSSSTGAVVPAGTPTFSPAAGTYSSSQTVTVSTSSSSATIYYTTDGTTPTASSSVYSGPITVSNTQTIQAIAVAGTSTSSPGSATYTITQAAPAPAFSLASGTYTSAQTVTITTVSASSTFTGSTTSGTTATPVTTIYYTTNGTTPTASSSVYTGPITVTATETLQAIATASGYSPSAPVSATYTINAAAGAPVFSPAGGTYSSAQTVTISTTTPSATIYYTTNGSTPTTSSPAYSGPIAVSTTETLKAIVVASGSSTSTPGSAAYTINLAAATPAFSPAGGTYTSAQTVTMSTTTPSATIYYTTDGSSPTTGSPVYAGPITVSASETVNAIAVASGFSSSTPGSAVYIINSQQSVTAPTFNPPGGTYTSAQTVTLTKALHEETIYYTTNGSIPTTSSPVYTGPITVSSTETITVIAAASGYANSAPVSATYTINLPGATAAFSPAGGTYTSAQTVTISTATPSATIYYTTNGSTPTTSSPVYSAPINVSATETLKAIVVASGYSSSAPASATYTINLPAATPAFSPAGGTYTSAQTVTISTATPSATIYYSTNGSTPTTSSPVYSGSIAVSATETLKAIAVASGSSASTPGSATYTINLPTATPAFSPAGGTYTSAQSVTISTATPATIYYTTNGSTPTTSSPVYSGPITVSTTETLKAIAVASGSSASTPGSATYTINLPSATPAFSPAGGTYTSAQSVTISTATPATIHYTTNGSTPTTSSPVYSGPMMVSTSETVKAIAVASGSSASAPVSATYTINLPSPAPAFSPAGGNYTSAQLVTISTATPATIYYTANGSTPTTSSAVYSGPITVSATETLRAIAVASGSSASAAVSATFTISKPEAAAPSPTFSPAGGTYSTAQKVRISDSLHKATIYYTTNGSIPTTSSPVYSGEITVSASETLRAITVANGYSNSAPASASFTITPPASAPTFSLAPGTYPSAQKVVISATTPSSTFTGSALTTNSTSSVTIHYTTNGTTPTTSSPVYTEPITVSASETVMAIAVASGYTPSPVASSSYTITQAATVAAPAPSISPAGGTYSSAQTVKISAGSHWATIYYTTNGTTPTTSSPVYTGPITVSSTETVKAVAVVSGYSPSTAVEANFTIGLRASDSPSFSITTTPAALTLTAGQSATTTVIVTPQNGFASEASLSCSGLPAGTTCDFSPATVTTSGEIASSTLTVATSPVNVASQHNSNPLYPGSALALSFCFFGRKRRRGVQLLAAAVAVALGLGLCTGCGVARVTPLAVTSTINVVATHGTLQPATSITLTVL